MKKIKTAVGYTAYETTAIETTKLGGIGVCDECNKFAASGYLVPVLNHYQCPKCFDSWNKRAKYYQEDIEFETQTESYFESKIPLTD